MEGFPRRARVPSESKLPVVKAESSIARLSDVAPSPGAVIPEAPSVLGGATSLPKPTQAMPSPYSAPSNHPSRQIPDVRPRQIPPKLAGAVEATPCLMYPSAGSIVCDGCRSVTYCTPACSDHDMVSEYYSGSAILVRQDEKPLYVKQVEALWKYNKYLLEPKITRVSRAVASRGSSNEVERHSMVVTAYLCKARFAQFYYDGQCFQKTAAKRAVPSPYEMKKLLGSLKRKSPPDFFARGSKKSKWEWTSDCDEESGGEQEAGEAGGNCARKN